MLKPNMGGIDKSVRIVAGIAALSMGYYYQSLWGVLGFIPLFTVTISWCPIYFPFKISTRVEQIVSDEL